MQIKAGTQTLEAQGVYESGRTATTRSLRIELAGPVTAEQLAALQSNDWEIYDGETLEGTQSGYTELLSHALVFCKTLTAEAAIAEKEAEKAAAVATLEAQVAAKELEIEETLESARAGLIATPTQGEAWDASKRYISGDEVTHDGIAYIAQRFSRGKTPGTDTEYWAEKPTTTERPEWSSIEDGTVITVGTEVMCEGVAYRCKDQHIKSTVYKPKAASTKWEIIEA